MKSFSLKSLKIPSIINLEYTRKDITSKKYENDRNYIAEENKDGFRCIFVLNEDKFSIFKVSSELESRNLSQKFPQFKPKSTNKMLVLDGFISGLNIELLTILVDGDAGEAVKKQETEKAIFFCFDCLIVNGKDIRDLSYMQRRAILFFVVDSLKNEFIKLIEASKDKENFYREMINKNKAGITYKNINESYSTKWFKRACVSFIYAQIMDISQNYQSIVYGLEDQNGKIIEYGKVTNKRQALVKKLKEAGNKAFGKIIKIQYQYVTLKNKLRNSRVVEIYFDNTSRKVETIKNIEKRGGFYESY